MASPEALELLRTNGADTSVYERLLEIWSQTNVGWSPAHEELAAVLGVDWSRVPALNRRRWVMPLSYML
jgi:hypothetical protein